MAVQFERLELRRGLPRRDWHLPHVPDLTKTFEKKYGRFSERDLKFFPDTDDLLGVSRFNWNQIEAVSQISSWIREGLRGLVFVEAAMGGGKSSIASLLAFLYGNNASQVNQHKIAYKQHGGKIVTHTSRTGEVVEMDTIPFENFVVLKRNLLEAMDQGGRFHVVDETQFTKGEADKVSYWREIRDWAVERDSVVLAAQLNLNFAGQIWDVSSAVTEAADAGVVLAANCVDCGKQAWMTKRLVPVSNGRWRPAKIDDLLEVVGDIKDSIDGEPRIDRYQPSCVDDYYLCTVEEAEAFDLSDEPLFKPLYSNRSEEGY